jgi:hypothetical protein
MCQVGFWGLACCTGRAWKPKGKAHARMALTDTAAPLFPLLTVGWLAVPKEAHSAVNPDAFTNKTGVQTSNVLAAARTNINDSAVSHTCV